MQVLIAPQSKTDHGLSSSTTTAPSHSQTEFFGQASKFMGSIGKKKVIQFATVIAKKVIRPLWTKVYAETS